MSCIDRHPKVCSNSVTRFTILFSGLQLRKISLHTLFSSDPPCLVKIKKIRTHYNGNINQLNMPYIPSNTFSQIHPNVLQQLNSSLSAYYYFYVTPCCNFSAGMSCPCFHQCFVTIIVLCVYISSPFPFPLK